jgi:hypothetical protein|tara:strand:- start:12 stop:326 length:315 start_codon:yes stop_codon:yes gene_type:complete
MGKKGNRTVAQIEKAFKVIHERDNVNEVSIRQVKGWLDDNTRDGMNIMRLANFLSKRPGFKMVRRERKRGTTETESFWTMPDLMQGPYQESPSRDGWVVDTPQR